MKILLIYILVLGFICVRDWFKVRNFDDYVVAGRSQGTPFVFMSLMATVLGASATVGVAEKTAEYGFAAFWWLGVGAVGLWLQAAFLSRRIHEMDVRTLPELAERTVGRAGRMLVALTIAISWVGVIAAQFAAVSEFVALVTGAVAGPVSVAVAAGLIVLYSLLGGQLSVVRTDVLQFSILTLGFGAAAVYLFGGYSGIEAHLAGLPLGVNCPAGPGGVAGGLGSFALLNAKFGVGQLAMMFLMVGGAFFLGPDVISRNLVARSGQVARRAVALGGFAIVAFSVVIVFLGMWANAYLPFVQGLQAAADGSSPAGVAGVAGSVSSNVATVSSGVVNPLFGIVSRVLPLPLAALLAMGLLSALVSSADTCLINAAAIFANDVLGVRRTRVVRLLVVLIGALAAGLALGGQDIISLLTSAYSIYTPGIVAPLTVAIVASKRFRIVRPLWYAGVCVGGLCGMLPLVVSGASTLPAVGIALSLALALAGLRRR